MAEEKADVDRDIDRVNLLFQVPTVFRHHYCKLLITAVGTVMTFVAGLIVGIFTTVCFFVCLFH